MNRRTLDPSERAGSAASTGDMPDVAKEKEKCMTFIRDFT
jgi:hypothetical protein